jgi:hypothetical protein
MTQLESVLRLIRIKSSEPTFSGTGFVCQKTCVKNRSIVDPCHALTSYWDSLSGPSTLRVLPAERPISRVGFAPTGAQFDVGAGYKSSRSCRSFASTISAAYSVDRRKYSIALFASPAHAYAFAAQPCTEARSNAVWSPPSCPVSRRHFSAWWTADSASPAKAYAVDNWHSERKAFSGTPTVRQWRQAACAESIISSVSSGERSVASTKSHARLFNSTANQRWLLTLQKVALA